MKRAGLIALALAACGDDGSGQPDAPVCIPTPSQPCTSPDGAVIDAPTPRETIMVAQPLVVGEIVEGIMTGGPGDYAVINLHAPTPDMDWNIHGHANNDTQIVDQAFKVTDLVDYVFLPPAEAKWYLLVRNSGATDLTVDLKVDLFGEMTWEWQ
ncbi:MAG TPA: hypothetical protein VM513_00115 [Kofleriaceae bacterium]|jgi:hypothetical protein|nr:hypothetical protein [Kofleriaceae bacterium]